MAIKKPATSLIKQHLRKRGRLYVVSGPSGCGKTTLCAKLLKKGLGLTRSVSVTTRPPRAGEKRNIDYIFTTKELFGKDIKKKRFLEHAKVFGNCYGTPKKFVEEALRKNKDIMLNIDVQGASQIKRNFKRAVLIFILPPSLKALFKRLKNRSTDTKKEVQKRLEIAEKELNAINMYDYVVLNDKLSTATEDIVAIIKADRCKRA